MCRFHTLVVVIFAVLLSASANAVVEQTTQDYVVCKNQKIVRTIRVVTPTEGEGCQTTYSKGGKDEIVGSARSLTGCRSFVENIKGNLEAAHWRCRKVDSAKITWSTQAVR